MSRRVYLVVVASVFSIAVGATAGLPEREMLGADEQADEKQNVGEKHLLRYQFRQGEVVRSKVIQQTKIETTIGGTTQTADMTSISTKAWRVTLVNEEGHITFDTMIEAIDMRHQMSGRQEVKYNSRTDAKPPAGYESAL
jgi:hypothetical protein